MKTKTKIENRVFRQSFSYAQSSRHAWWLQGHRLLRASKILLLESFYAREKMKNIKGGYHAPDSESFEIMENSFLCEQASTLLALALENFMKSLWMIQNNPEASMEIRKLPEEIRKHDLIDLAEITKLNVSDA